MGNSLANRSYKLSGMYSVLLARKPQDKAFLIRDSTTYKQHRFGSSDICFCFQCFDKGIGMDDLCTAVLCLQWTQKSQNKE